MVKALADWIEASLKKINIQAVHIEGRNEARWALLDYGDVVAHIFHEEAREFYNIEWLWSEAPRIRLKEK